MVRAATEADLVAVATLSQAWAAEGITWGMQASPLGALRERLHGPFAVAVDRGRVIGYAFGQVRADAEDAIFPRGARVFEVEEIFVAAGHRQRGVGGALLDALLAAARAAGVHHFSVYSATVAVDAAMRFYAARGFRPWSVQMFRSE